MLPACYDEFRGTKLYNCIEHPAPQGERVYLAVPFADKDAVKRLGARWGLGQGVRADTMSIGEVKYTQEQALALLEWTNRFKSWWYWSGAAVRDDRPAEERLKSVEDAHSRSPFSGWPVDSAVMMRVWVEDTSSTFFLFDNPNKNATQRQARSDVHL
jgi:hypothetical protein